MCVSPMKNLLVLVLALSSVGACASTTTFFGGRPDPTAQHGEKSQRFAAAQPTTITGAQEISDEDKALYKEMADWTQTLKSNGHGHRAPEVQEILRSREAFIVKVGDRLDNKEESIRLVKYLLRDSDFVRDAVIRYSPQVVAAKQAALKANHSYKHPDKRYRDQRGNCVLASKPFGREGALNQGVLFRVKTESEIYARCYLSISSKAYGRNLRLSVWAGTSLVADHPGTRAPAKPYIDFVLPIGKSSLHRSSGKSPESGMVIPLTLKGEWDVLGTHRKHDNTTGTKTHQNRTLRILAETSFFFDNQ